ncbi:hypothetical protein OF83DRAFT_1168172 [Amylostereum chailletii]|nr:hypothetical protein OF83DRAFT_1168172 [Amylostereum chailletii]
MPRAFSDAEFEKLPLLFRVMDYCIRENNWEQTRARIREYFPSQVPKLCGFLEQHIQDGVFDSSWLDYFTQRDPMDHHRERYGLQMSRDKYRMAKALIHAIVEKGRFTLDDLVDGRIDLVVVIYACIDLSLPLPSNIRPATFWQHVSNLMETGRELDLYQDLRPWYIPSHIDALPDDCRRNKDDDPLGTVESLFYIFRRSVLPALPLAPVLEPIPEGTPQPEDKEPFEVYVAASVNGTGAVLSLPHGPQHFSLYRARSPLGLEYQRESYALLDATCVWAHLWTGRKVRFTVTTERLAACINVGPQDATVRRLFPVLEAVTALSLKWNFTFEGHYLPMEVRPRQGDSWLPRCFANLCANGFEERCGLVIQVVDSLMGLLTSFEDEICDGLKKIVLKPYMEALVEHLGPAAEGWEPGRLYQRMRLEQQSAVAAQIMRENGGGDEGRMVGDEGDMRRRDRRRMKELEGGMHEEWVREARRLAESRGSAIVELARMDLTRGGAEEARLSFWPQVDDWKKVMEDVHGLP